jgi:hypothetical protein
MRASYNCSQEDWFHKMWKIVFKLRIISNRNNYVEFSCKILLKKIASLRRQDNSISRRLRWNRQIFLSPHMTVNHNRALCFIQECSASPDRLDRINLPDPMPRWKVKHEPIDWFTEICQITQERLTFHLWWALFFTTEKPKETIDSCIFDFSDMRLYAEGHLQS